MVSFRPIMHRPPSTQAPRSLSHELTQCGNDQGQLVPLIEAIENNLGRKPEQASADSGYCSEANLAARQAPDSRERKNWRTADATDAKEDRRRRLRNALPIAKASGGTGVRTDQTGARIPPVPVARRRKSARRVGNDLHRPHPPEE